ncbi:DUF402 domain-containing protein [Actinacidiphila acidipaludis]|uniref:DUF402 domain-containing protein n=1 Tax=Actinacidiphila acidipaludis TaxID=2873382 RepID=A0ABS7QI18_9ACTN|nr:DUF402 domain-containing protein [Streptomyces acidipaludis]MBY8882821.1 DUF402 domain-containing protein [Streptomyces acidipaludis]
MRRFTEGETVVRRDVFRGKVWSAHAFEAVEDAPEALVTAGRPGAEVLASTTWFQWLLTGDANVRLRALPDLAGGTWELGRWSWRDTALLQWVPPKAWFSVYAFHDASSEAGLTHWYVNFQRPMRRTAIGFDTFDLLVDLVVAPDLSRWDWKDEDEYAHGRRLGVVSETDHRAVRSAREEAVALIESRSGPFAAVDGWTAWRPDARRDAPVLPDDVLTAGLTGTA